MDDSHHLVWAILAKQKAHVLPYYLRCLLVQTFPLHYIHLYIRTNDNTDDTEGILRQFVHSHGHKFASVYFCSDSIDASLTSIAPHDWSGHRFRILAALRQASVTYALERGAHYFVCDCDNFVAPQVLQVVMATRGLGSVVAPLLKVPGRLYSNYHGAVDRDGYYARSEHYDAIFAQQVTGLIQVPVVHCTYFIPHDVLQKTQYTDDTTRHEYVIVSANWRKAGVPQLLDNRHVYGLITFCENDEDMRALAASDAWKSSGLPDCEHVIDVRGDDLEARLRLICTGVQRAQEACLEPVLRWEPLAGKTFYDLFPRSRLRCCDSHGPSQTETWPLAQCFGAPAIVSGMVGWHLPHALTDAAKAAITATPSARQFVVVGDPADALWCDSVGIPCGFNSDPSDALRLASCAVVHTTLDEAPLFLRVYGAPVHCVPHLRQTS